MVEMAQENVDRGHGRMKSSANYGETNSEAEHEQRVGKMHLSHHHSYYGCCAGSHFI